MSELIFRQSSTVHPCTELMRPMRRMSALGLRFALEYPCSKLLIRQSMGLLD